MAHRCAHQKDVSFGGGASCEGSQEHLQICLSQDSRFKDVSLVLSWMRGAKSLHWFVRHAADCGAAWRTIGRKSRESEQRRLKDSTVLVTRSG
mmetsp:Transcript_25943/g.68033  ORF Transcript_25943/g.68033 Transcript_25943/m.68033 type:complete len:93 (+) Transcript_25943:1181-1459(+)